jgi:hypothetical protein
METIFEKSSGDIKYDRQERTIGVDAVKNLKEAKVLILGFLFI